MKRIAIITTFICVLLSNGLAQNNSMGFAAVHPHTHALIIGISDYRNIDDLEFADDDALAFREYLLNTMPGKSDSSNIKMLLNEAAISSSIYAALENLVTFAKEGDRVYIYFSGHGDSENATIFKSGFLLTHETPKHSYYTNSINVDILNNFIHTLSIQNKADVFFIGDACHSGNLNNLANSSAVSTAKVLSQNVAEEVRLLSCQPNEISIEGKQWGNGRGLFSYHLIHGLYGKADGMGMPDGKISLNELNVYLSTNVPKDAHPISQFPGVYGPMNKEVGLVNETLLALIDKEIDSKKTSSLMAANGKGYEDMFLKNLSEDQLTIYKAYHKSLDKGQLRLPLDASAYHFLDQLRASSADVNLTALLTRNLAAQLQEQPQLYMNDLTDIEKRWNQADIKYTEWAEDLKLSASLIGEEHPYYNIVMSKYYFMSAADAYKKILGTTNAGLQKKYAIESIKEVNKAIAEDSLVVFYHTLKGMALNKMGHHEAAIRSYDASIKISPDYPYAYCNKGVALMHLTKYEDAIAAFDKTIALDKAYTNAYLYKIKALKKLGKIQESIAVYEEMLDAVKSVKGM
ncbi:MAG: caspase family protein [Chitinophagales bacterium]